MKKRYGFLVLASVSTLALSAPAYAQDAGGDDFATNDQAFEAGSATDVIVVTARRRAESVQDVPAVVDTVTAEDFAQLNIRQFNEVQALVPGLNLSNDDNGTGGNARLRGVNFDVAASGNNPTVEFYLNDAPITAGVVLQQAYDIGQVEVLRGPQGTLRGRASPSGSITVTTRKPDLYEAGAYVSATGNDIGGLNFNGGVGIPIAEGVAAIRIAGLYDVNEGNRVTPLDAGIDGRDPRNRTASGRVTALLHPTDWLRLEGMYQRIDRNNRSFDHYRTYPGDEALVPEDIDADDRKSIQDAPRLVDQVYDIYNGRAEVDFAGQTLIYQGQYYTQKVNSFTPQDNGNRFPGIEFGQTLALDSTSESHELRLQNQDRVFGMFDYVIGAFENRNEPNTDLIQQTMIAPGGNPLFVNETFIERRANSVEQSIFGNLTFHLSDATEISGGLRYIDYESEGTLLIGAGPLRDDPDIDENKLIYTASVKHRFSPDLMVYASTGSSWRPPINVTGVFGGVTPEAQQFINIGAEESTSYEIGLKSELFDRRVRLNVSGFYQDFKNYPYRAPTGPFYVLDETVDVIDPDNLTGNEEIDTFNFIAGVPVEVYGIEGELGFDINDRWDISLVASYALGKIKGGTIPCNDLNNDGEPDASPTTPTVGQLLPNGIGRCDVTQRSSAQSPFSATVQSEYNFPLTNGVDGYLRGLYSFYGKSRNDPTLAFDDIDAYGIMNLYTGVRDPEGTWEVTAFVKNLFDTQKVLVQGNRAFTSFRNGAAAATFTSNYQQITTTAPQEFGVNVRFAFGSR